MPDIERVIQATLLGIDIASSLSTAAYVNRMLLQINQPLYLLSQLKSQGMAVQALHQLFAGLIMSKITYALPASAGQLTVDDRNRINAISRKTLRRGVTHTVFDTKEIIDNFDRKLFSKITHSGHCLHHLLLNTVLTVLGKENIITSCLMLNSRCIKNCFINNDACLSLDDNTLYVLYYF